MQNLSLLGKKPLLAWSLEAMHGFQPGFDSVWVSTDDPEIQQAKQRNIATHRPTSL